MAGIIPLINHVPESAPTKSKITIKIEIEKTRKVSATRRLAAKVIKIINKYENFLLEDKPPKSNPMKP